MDITTNNNIKSELHPLEVLLCEDCKLFQLSVRIDPKTIFSDYFYHSSYVFKQLSKI